AEAHERGLRELQARLDGFRYGIGDADRIEVAGMHRIARSRHDEQVRPQRAYGLDDLVNGCLRVNGDDHGRRLHEPAALQEGEVCGVAVIDLPAAPAIVGDGRRVAVAGDEWEVMTLEHGADDLADAAVTDDDGMRAEARRRRDRPLR